MQKKTQKPSTYEATVTIHGRVQNVGFRYFVRSQAKKRKIRGYVKNQNDGTVLAVLQGDRETLKEMISQCRKGPILANVTKCEEEWTKPNLLFEAFEILR